MTGRLAALVVFAAPALAYGDPPPSPLEIEAAPTAASGPRVMLGAVRFDETGAARTVTFRFVDGAGQPVRGAVITVAAGEGVVAEPLREEDSAWVTTVHQAVGRDGLVLRFQVAGQGGGTVVLPRVDSSPRFVTSAPPPRRAGIELGVFGAGHFLADNTAAGAALELGARLRLGFGTLALPLRVGYDRYLQRSRDVVSIALPIHFRFRPPEAKIAPYLGVLPLMMLEPGGARYLGIGGFVGLLVSIGSGSASLEAGYQYTDSVPAPPDTLSATGLFALLGYRLPL